MSNIDHTILVSPALTLQAASRGCSAVEVKAMLWFSRPPHGQPKMVNVGRVSDGANHEGACYVEYHTEKDVVWHRRQWRHLEI